MEILNVLRKFSRILENFEGFLDIFSKIFKILKSSKKTLVIAQLLITQKLMVLLRFSSEVDFYRAGLH